MKYYLQIPELRLRYFEVCEAQKIYETRDFISVYVMRCVIWYHLYNSKNVKNTHGGVSRLVKLQASACNFTKSNTPPWVFFTFVELYIWK